MSENLNPPSSPPTPVAGHRKKPIWMKNIGWGLILVPFLNILFTFLVLDVPVSNSVGWTYGLGFIRPEIWVLNLLLFCSGLALMRARTWTHIFASFAIVAVIIYSIATWEPSSYLGPIVFGVVTALALLLIVVMYSRQFRDPYYNPQVRWWESSPRFAAKLKGSVVNSADGDPYTGEILDISRSGIYISLDEPHVLTLGDFHQVILPNKIEVRGEVVRLSSAGYGLRFVKVSWTQRRLIKKLLKQLGEDPTKLVR